MPACDLAPSAVTPRPRTRSLLVSSVGADTTRTAGGDGAPGSHSWVARRRRAPTARLSPSLAKLFRRTHTGHRLSTWTRLNGELLPLRHLSLPGRYAADLYPMSSTTSPLVGSDVCQRQQLVLSWMSGSAARNRYTSRVGTVTASKKTVVLGVGIPPRRDRRDLRRADFCDTVRTHGW